MLCTECDWDQYGETDQGKHIIHYSSRHDPYSSMAAVACFLPLSETMVRLTAVAVMVRAPDHGDIKGVSKECGRVVSCEKRGKCAPMMAIPQLRLSPCMKMIDILFKAKGKHDKDNTPVTNGF